MSAIVKTVMPYPGERKFTHRAYCAACRWYGPLNRDSQKASADARQHNDSVEHERENARPEGETDGRVEPRARLR